MDDIFELTTRAARSRSTPRTPTTNALAANARPSHHSSTAETQAALLSPVAFSRNSSVESNLSLQSHVVHEIRPQRRQQLKNNLNYFFQICNHSQNGDSSDDDDDEDDEKMSRNIPIVTLPSASKQNTATLPTPPSSSMRQHLQSKFKYTTEHCVEYESNLKYALFQQLQPCLHSAISEQIQITLPVATASTEISDSQDAHKRQISLVPLWKYVQMKAHVEDEYDIHPQSLYLIFINECVERAYTQSGEVMMLHFLNTCYELANQVQYQQLITQMFNTDPLLKTESLLYLTDKESNMMKFMVVMYRMYQQHHGQTLEHVVCRVLLGIYLQDYVEVEEFLMRLIASTLADCLPTDHRQWTLLSDKTVAAEHIQKMKQLMQFCSQLTMLSAMMFSAVEFKTATNGRDPMSEIILCNDRVVLLCEHTLQYLSKYKVMLPMLAYATRTSLLYISLLVERFDVVKILLENQADGSQTIPNHQEDKKHLTNVDWEKYYHLLHAIDSDEDEMKSKVSGLLSHSLRPRAYSMQTEMQWRQIDPALPDIVGKYAQLGLIEDGNDVRFLSDHAVDEGYRYVTFLSREECFEILKDKAMGSFMLRPNYEKLPHTGTEVESDTEQQSFFNQFLLSFRTGVPQGNNSSTSELVKHAVIRREVHLDVGRVTFQYRCGKLGPEMTLGSILRGISQIISHGLTFEAVVPSAIPVFNSTGGSTANSPAGRTQHANSSSIHHSSSLRQNLDVNGKLWQALSMHLPVLMQNTAVDLLPMSEVAQNTYEEEAENGNDIDSDEEKEETLSLASGNTAYSDMEEKDNNSMGNVGDNFHSSSARYFQRLYAELLSVLSMRSFSFQMLPLLYIADSFISPPVTNSVNIVSEVVVWSSLQDRFQSTTISDTFHSLYLPFLHKLPLYPLVQNRVFTEQGSTNNSLLSSKGSSGSVGIFYLLLSPCLSYYLHSERHLLDLAVTPEIKSSAHLHQAHTATTIDSASPFISSISSFYCNTYKDQENLVLEALMQRLFKTIGTKMVKCANTSFSSPAQSNGGLYENILHFDCVEVTELVNELARHIAVVEEFHANSFKHTALPRITEDTDEDKEGKSDRASSKFALLDLDESSSGGSSDNEEGEQDRGNKTSGKSDEGEDYFHDVKESNHREGDAIGLNENENEEKDSLSTKILQNLKQVRGKHQALFHPSRAAQSSSSALSSTHQQNLNMKMSPLHLLTLLSSSKGISSAPTSPTSPTSASYDKIAMQLLHVILSILKHPPNTTPSGKNAVSVSGASSRFQHYPYISNNSTSSGNSNQAPESTAVTSTNGSNNLSVDLAQRILTLYYRHRGVRQVHKLPEIAFLATTPFYKYIDMWEVKIVNELNELQDSAVLGRHLYKPLPTTTSSGKSDYDQVIANIYFLNNAATASTASRSMRRNSSADMELKERQVFELQSFLSLWHFLEAEEYLVNSVALSHLSEDPQHRTAKYVSQQSSAASPTTPTSPTNSSSATANTNASVNGAYVKTLQHFMNKNLYFKRLFLPHRYVAMLQVDIYGLKQVTQLRASLHNNSNTQSNAAAAAARRPSILSCGDPSNATLTPSLTVHTSAIECYAVIRLVKDYTGSASSGFTGTDCILSATNPLQYNAYLHGSRVYPEGSFITASKRLDPHMNSSNNAAKKFEQAAAASQYSNSAGYQSKAILAQISQSLDYDWRTQSIFRFALPEGWISLLQEHHHHHHHRSHAQHPCQRIRTPPPIKITISVFEKSFFGDTKIGDMELNLTDFSDKNVVRDWFPLLPPSQHDARSPSNTYSWMIYTQAKLRFHLMQLDDAAEDFPYLSNTSYNPVASSSSSEAVGIAGLTRRPSQQVFTGQLPSVSSAGSLNTLTSANTNTNANTSNPITMAKIPSLNNISSTISASSSRNATQFMSNVKSAFAIPLHSNPNSSSNLSTISGLSNDSNDRSMASSTNHSPTPPISSATTAAPANAAVNLFSNALKKVKSTTLHSASPETIPNTTKPSSSTTQQHPQSSNPSATTPSTASTLKSKFLSQLDDFF